MLTDNITLNTREYRAQVVNPTSTLRAISGLPFGTSRTLKVAHELTSKGVVNTAITIDVVSVDTVSGSSTLGKVIDDRVMVKITYDPTISHDYSAAVTSALTDLISFLNVPANVTMLLNKEH